MELDWNFFQKSQVLEQKTLGKNNSEEYRFINIESEKNIKALLKDEFLNSKKLKQPEKALI